MGIFGNGFQAFAQGLGRVGAAFHTDPKVLQDYDENQNQQAYRKQQIALLQQKPQQDWDLWQRQQDYKAAHPDAPQPTEMQRNFDAYQGMDAPHKQQFGAYQDLVNPRYTQGPNGTMFIPRTAPGGLPGGYDPNQWEVVPGPQAGPQQNTATPSGSPLQQPQMSQGYQGPSPEQMHQLYRQQFGARGDAMFQEWLRNGGAR